MGLDWFVQPKEVDGRVVTPKETAGFKRLDLADPETVEAFRKIYAEQQKEVLDPGPMLEVPSPSPGFRGLWERLSGAEGRRQAIYAQGQAAWEELKADYDRWHRPFEEAVKDFAAEDPPPVAQEAAADRQDALAEYLGAGGVYDFRANELLEEENAVTAYAAYDLKMEYTDELYLDKTPEEMVKLADDFSRSLAKYLRSEEEKHQDSIDIVRAVVPWLRFWGRHGHGIVADY